MNPLIQSNKITILPFLIALLLCFGVSPTAQAVTPAPDGGYPGQHTAEGEDALFSLIVDPDCGESCANTAIGFHALYSDTTGSYNTAVGDGDTPAKNKTATTHTP